MFFSSGSTGPTKPVSHSHRSLLSCTYNISSREFAEETEGGKTRLLSVNIGHIGGFISFISTMAGGSTLVFFTEPRPDDILKAIHKYQPSMLGLYPKDAIFVAKQQIAEGEFDLKCVKVMAATAAVFPYSINGPLKKKFTGLTGPIRQVYGCSEGLLFTVTAPLDDPETEVGVGVLLPHAELKVVSLDKGEAVGEGQRGELWFRTPFIMLGYKDRPDLTSQAITRDGWYKTGDYGYYDAKGRIHLLERVKDLIHLPSGYFILPSKIENIILQCEGVAQVGVAGVPAFAILGGDEIAPARFLPRAFVILRPGAKTTTEDIVNFVKERAESPDYHLAGGAEFIKTMVTSPAGKVYRTKLREDFIKNFQKQKRE